MRIKQAYKTQTYKQYKSAEKGWQTDRHMLRKFYSTRLAIESLIQPSYGREK